MYLSIKISVIIYSDSEKYMREASGNFRLSIVSSLKARYHSFHMPDRLISPIMTNNQCPAPTKLRRGICAFNETSAARKIDWREILCIFHRAERVRFCSYDPYYRQSFIEYRKPR